MTRICADTDIRVANQNFKSITNETFKGSNLVTEVAAKCYEASRKAQPDFAYGLRRGIGSTIGYLTPVVASVAGPAAVLAYKGAKFFEDSSLTIESAKAVWAIGGTLAALMAMDKITEPFGFRPVAFTANLIGYLYASTVLKAADSAKNWVADNYDTHTKKVQELTDKNHKMIIKSLTSAYNGIGDAIKQNFSHAFTLEQKYKVAQEVTKFSQKLPEIKKAFAEIDLNEEEILAILEKCIGAINQIDLSFQCDLEETEAATAHNYELFVKLPKEMGVENCVPAASKACIKAAKDSQMGWGSGVKAATKAVGLGALVGFTPPILTISALEIVSYFKKDIIVMATSIIGADKLGLAIGLVATGIGMLATRSVLNRKWENYNQKCNEAQEAYAGYVNKAQGYLAKAFNDVANNLKPEDAAKVRERIPSWESEISRYPELNAGQALNSLRNSVTNNQKKRLS